jgi:hypothetical protein
MGRPPQSASPPPSSSPRVITFGFLCIRITIELHSRWLTRTPHVSRGVVHTPHTLKHPSADKGLAVMADDDDNNNNSKNGKRKNIRHMCVRSEREKLTLVKGCGLAFLDTRSDLQSSRRLPLFTRSRIRRNDLPHAGHRRRRRSCVQCTGLLLAPNNCCRSPFRSRREQSSEIFLAHMRAGFGYIDSRCQLNHHRASVASNKESLVHLSGTNAA